jgi:hypothetical protein
MTEDEIVSLRDKTSRSGRKQVYSVYVIAADQPVPRTVVLYNQSKELVRKMELQEGDADQSGRLGFKRSSTGQWQEMSGKFVSDETRERTREDIKRGKHIGKRNMLYVVMDVRAYRFSEETGTISAGKLDALFVVLIGTRGDPESGAAWARIWVRRAPKKAKVKKKSKKKSKSKNKSKRRRKR